MVNHFTRGLIIRGIIFILIVIVFAAWKMFGDIPNGIYWAFIISINVSYHTMEYIIRLRRERDQYKTAYNALSEITMEMINHTTEMANDIKDIISPETFQFLDKFSDRFRDARDLT